MAHLAPEEAAAAPAAMGTASAGLAVLEPELLVHALLFVDHAEAVRTACTCKALRSTLLGPSCPDAGYLWRCNFRRRWLFGLRRRHRPAQQQASSSSSSSSSSSADAASAPALGCDFQAYRTRHEQARRMAEGKAGEYRVHTVRPPIVGEARGRFRGFLVESEGDGGGGSAAADGAEGPVAYVGTSTGQVMRVGFRPQQPDGGEWAFGPLWEASVLRPRESVMDIAREGNVLACGTDNGRVIFLHAGTGQPLARAGEGTAPGGPFVIDTGLDDASHLLWLEGGKRLAVAAVDTGHVHLYCPRTGHLCQEIEPPSQGGAAGALGGSTSDSIKALVRRPEGGAEGRAGERPHFLVLHWGMARFFVQDTAAETPDADSTGTDFRPYSEHGRVLPTGGLFNCAVFAPAGEGLPSDEEAGAYRVFIGGLGSGVHTAAFNVHPRIRLAQLFQADGGIMIPMRTLMLGGEVTELKVRIIQVPKPEGGPGTERALLLGAAIFGCLVIWSLHEPPCQPGGADEPVLESCQIMFQRSPTSPSVIFSLYMDDEKVFGPLDGTSLQVLTLPRDPAPYPVSRDPTPVRGRFPDREPLYCLRGGSNTFGSYGSGMQGLAVGAAEVLVAFNDKLRLYDFTP